jgi:dual-specificity kinase
MKHLHVSGILEICKSRFADQAQQDIIPSNNSFFKHFLDLLSKIFVYDPAQRITAKQALNHPWFREIAHPDDGTEAAKIRMENEEKARHAHFVG